MNLQALQRAGLCLLGAACIAVPQASALIELDRAVLILNTQFGVSYDSNILGQRDNVSDTLLTFGPSLEYRRDGGRGMITINAGANVVVYTKDSDKNHEDYRLSGAVTLPLTPDSPLSGAANASFSRATTVNETVGDLVTSTTIGLGANGGYAFSERFSGTAGASWGSTENENFGDNESIGLSLGVSLQEFLFRRLPLTLSYGYSTSESTNDPTAARKLDTTSHSFNAGTSGQISPKVSGSISVGMRSTDDGGTAFGPGSSNDSGVIGSASLAWAFDDLTKVGLGFNKSLGISADNQSTDTTTLSLTVSRTLSEQLSANAGVSHSWNEFRALNRDDKLLGFNAGLSYQVRRNWTAGVNYQYSDNSSDLPTVGFERHVVGATLTARF